jgi:cardiolipin synthase
VLLGVALSAHIVLTKEDVRAAIGWTGLVWLAPFVGPIAYVLFGINRIRRQALRTRGRRPAGGGPALTPTGRPGGGGGADAADAALPAALRPLARLVTRATGVPLTLGNAVDPLVNGDEAYPAMLAAIDAARHTIAFATYIFDRGRAGDRFVESLGRAVERGVAVRVLIDGAGAHYSRPSIVAALRRRHVPVELFLPSWLPLFHPYMNLRNHRKLLVVDGAVAFCGGMNVRDGCVLADQPRHPTQDVHFRVRGPVVRQLASAFAFDWAFAAGEQLAGDGWLPRLDTAGAVAARGIPDGPDEDFETLLLTLLGALAQASQSVRVVTPYFLPDPPLIDALRTAALRGVAVEIVLPERNNLRLVHWAAMAQLHQVVRWGCRVYFSRPPFDHSKLCVIDGQWCLVGSANWDPRSLRLNFEYLLECYSPELAARLEALIDAKIAGAKPVTLTQLERRHPLIRLRDGLVRLAQPYL